jgi:hypothetical protein
VGGVSAPGTARLDFPLRFTPGAQAPVAQRIEHLTTDQKVWGSNPYGRAFITAETLQFASKFALDLTESAGLGASTVRA